ncbi:receptor-like kinase TMK4 [Camellia sinensis]|uniref:receptor-like kinase TMK4 n=1 Tax=Camellia sinensis TaxID=4442 RepID=UPI0010367EBF|nr:receptor-like kinase TMK4 [Camellia sinensis]
MEELHTMNFHEQPICLVKATCLEQGVSVLLIKECFLRIDIMIDVACAMEYLHHGYSMPVAHCDLKPSNVLLDDDMVAHVSDFSFAKLLGGGESIAQTRTIATFGYIALDSPKERMIIKDVLVAIKKITLRSDSLGEEVDVALNLTFEEAGLNPSNPPSTSGRVDISFEDIFTNLGDLPGAYPENMAGEALTQMARKKNAERLAARRKAEANRSEPPIVAGAESSLPALVEETTHIDTAKTEHITTGKTTKIGRRQHDAIEQIDFLTAEIENEKSKAMEASLKAKSEAMKVAEERVSADAEAEKAKSSDQLRLAAEERANVSDDALKLAQEVIAKLEADLEASKKAKEIADSEISKAFQPIPYEQMDVELLESDPED